MRTLSKVAAAGLLALLTPSSLVWADPVVVRSGSVRFDTGDPMILEFRGDGFDLFALFGSIGTTGATRCVNMPCPAGTPVDLSSVFGGPLGSFDLGAGFATVNGVQYGSETGPAELFLTGTLAFDAPVVPIPDDGSLVTGMGGPFVLSGRVIGSYEVPVVTPLFELTLTGRGRAAMGVNFEDGTYKFVAASYVFDDPIPEPATLLLVGSGVVGLAVRRRRGRSGSG